MCKRNTVAWLNSSELCNWMREAHTREEFERRLAIRLVNMDYSVGHIADILAVSETTIQRWIKSFNCTGPQGITPRKRGGRRRSLLTLEQENELVKEWSRCGDANAKKLHDAVQLRTGKQVSLKYVYDLIRRHRAKSQIDG